MDSEMQTEPDPIQRDIIIVDDKDRYVLGSSSDLPSIYAKLKHKLTIHQTKSGGEDSESSTGKSCGWFMKLIIYT